MPSEEDDYEYLCKSEAVLMEVLDAIEEASVNLDERKIIWPDATRLSIEETARKIHSESGAPLDMVQSHVIGWIEVIYEPKGLDEDQMEEFEASIEQWIASYEDRK